MLIRAKTKSIQQVLEAALNGDISYLNDVSDQDLSEAVCTSGCFAIHWAAGNNQVDVLHYLLNVRRNIANNVNQPAIKKSKGRTALHYASRNGCLEACQWLIDVANADVNPKAKHGVTPFQLAVWQNRLEICQYLVNVHKVDPCQVNDFDCGAVHWLGISPFPQQSSSPPDLLPLATWLAQQTSPLQHSIYSSSSSSSRIDFSKRQRQGHTALHKAAWGGQSLEYIQYLRDSHNLWDDTPDDAGNYAADLADMAQTPRHDRIAQYLRQHCSLARQESCQILGIPPSASNEQVRKAYLAKARQFHPDGSRLRLKHAEERGDNDSQHNDDNNDNHDFDAIHKAYQHLIKHGGAGNQSNPAHSLKLMLQVSEQQHQQEEESTDTPNIDNCTTTTTTTTTTIHNTFKARLIAVLLEYGDKGLDLSNIKKKWNQVWHDEPFPTLDKRIKLSDFILQQAGDVVELRTCTNTTNTDQNGTSKSTTILRVFAKTCSQAKVQEAAAAAANQLQQ